ncbi:type 1 glutamine amidotransferase family protein [Glycomyces endophyticus]|uniref:Type 1 glutamine amidotransferase family protein n=1 Tax=Glycomyces endophyticus TaxID=480996 RepID=A0ABN2GLH7_9ACTN
MVQHVHTAVYDTMADWEVGFATAHINNDEWQVEPGRYRVVTVGASREPVTSMGGLRITPDIALDDLSPADSAMLVLPGAGTWLTGDNAPFAKAARAFLDAGVPVAAICGATGGLAAEGLLDDRRHTSNAREFTEAFGSKGGDLYCDAPAVTDRGLITASGTAPVHFAREVFAALGLYTPEVLASWFKLYGLNDPAGYYELAGGAA